MNITFKIKMENSSQKSMSNRPLADMHANGVYFDPKIKEALKNERKLKTTQQKIK